MGRIFYDFRDFGKRNGAFLWGLRKICRVRWFSSARSWFGMWCHKPEGMRDHALKPTQRPYGIAGNQRVTLPSAATL